jgi:hypothetical protein
LLTFSLVKPDKAKCQKAAKLGAAFLDGHAVRVQSIRPGNRGNMSAAHWGASRFDTHEKSSADHLINEKQCTKEVVRKAAVLVGFASFLVISGVSAV